MNQPRVYFPTLPRYACGMRHTALPALLLTLSLAACGSGGGTAPQPARSTQLDVDQVKASAPVVGELVRAASVCGVPVSITAQDRAARIEAAALDIAVREGGMTARDSYLRSVQPPTFDPRRRGQDRAQYCNPKRLDVERMDGFLSGPDGAALTQRAEAIRAGR
jgi:hypothetical protein